MTNRSACTGTVLNVAERCNITDDYTVGFIWRQDKIRILKVFVLGLFLFYLLQVIKYDFKAKCVFLALMVRRVILACSDEVCCKVNLLIGSDRLFSRLLGKNYRKRKQNVIYSKFKIISA